MAEMRAADELVVAIRLGDAERVERLVAGDPVLASAPLGGTHGTRTPLHVVTDWPGFWPNGPQIAHILLAGDSGRRAAGANSQFFRRRNAALPAKRPGSSAGVTANLPLSA
jgi:hypothetical protein